MAEAIPPPPPAARWQGFWATAWRRCGRQWRQPYTVAENANEKTGAMMGT